MGATSRVSNATKLKTHGVFKETTQEQYAVVKEISWEETQLGIGMDTVMSIRQIWDPDKGKLAS